MSTSKTKTEVCCSKCRKCMELHGEWTFVKAKVLCNKCKKDLDKTE